jgi:hypothetical protein
MLIAPVALATTLVVLPVKEIVVVRIHVTRLLLCVVAMDVEEVPLMNM